MNTIIQLAKVDLAGGNCAFALHDALLEMGFVRLAEHYKNNSLHVPHACQISRFLIGELDIKCVIEAGRYWYVTMRDEMDEMEKWNEQKYQ